MLKTENSAFIKSVLATGLASYFASHKNYQGPW